MLNIERSVSKIVDIVGNGKDDVVIILVGTCRSLVLKADDDSTAFTFLVQHMLFSAVAVPGSVGVKRGALEVNPVIAIAAHDQEKSDDRAGFQLRLTQLPGVARRQICVVDIRKNKLLVDRL